MKVVACTLLADGSSDRVLEPILGWLLDEHCPHPYTIDYAPIKTGPLELRLAQALHEYPCDLLFVHRDAERIDPMDRQAEVDAAWSAHARAARLVTIIPVRMTEAWLLFNEDLIRQAAGNPNGTMPLQLPRLARMELLPDPKETLFEALRVAAGRSPSRMRKFNPEVHRHRITEIASSFAPLRELAAFQRLEAQVRAVFQY